MLWSATYALGVAVILGLSIAAADPSLIAFVALEVALIREFFIAANEAWSIRNESYTAAGPWMVEIHDGGAS